MGAPTIRDASDFQRSQVVGANLKAGTAYTLFVNGNAIATKSAASEQVDTDPSGGAVEFIYFKGRPRRQRERKPASVGVLEPVTTIQHVEVRDDKEQVVLSGDFSS